MLYKQTHPRQKCQEKSLDEVASMPRFRFFDSPRIQTFLLFLSQFPISIWLSYTWLLSFFSCHLAFVNIYSIITVFSIPTCFPLFGRGKARQRSLDDCSNPSALLSVPQSS